MGKDSVKVVKFKKSPLTEVQNQTYFLLGTDSTQHIYAVNGYRFPDFKPKKWIISPLVGGNLLYFDGKKVKTRDVFSAEDYEEQDLYKVKKKISVTNLAYAQDGTFILVATSDSTLTKCSTAAKDKQREKYSIKLSAVPSKILLNESGNTALLIEGKALNVLNIERGVSRKLIEFPSKIVDVALSDDNRECAVLLDNGEMKTIEIASLKEKKSYQLSGKVKNCRYLSQGKYIIVANEESFQVVNLLTSRVDYILTNKNAALLGLDVFTSSFDKEQMAYYDTESFNIIDMSAIERYHTMDVKRELDLRMAEWSKMMPGESESDYRSRVNDESRAKYALELERELVTGLAGDKIATENAQFGNYFEGNQALAIDFNSMPSIYLNIPAEDLNDLKTIDDIEFFNTVYGLDENDDFEVIYTEARNKNTGKVYIYDNLSRKGIAMDEDSFVPMEVVQLANIEAAKLESIKEEIVETAKNENILTDHTHINVATEVEQDFDADGNKILNYKIDYMYEVEEEYSARDDFKAGKYNTNESNAAMQMMNIIQNSLQGDFAKYTTDSKKLEVSVTGSADAVPIIGTLKYKGEYDDIVDQLVYENNELTKMSITKSAGIKTNQQLALVRAVGVADYMNKNIVKDTTIPVDYKYYIEVSEEKGSEFRRIKVSLKFVDAFKK